MLIFVLQGERYFDFTVTSRSPLLCVLQYIYVYIIRSAITLSYAFTLVWFQLKKESQGIHRYKKSQIISFKKSATLNHIPSCCSDRKFDYENANCVLWYALTDKPGRSTKCTFGNVVSLCIDNGLCINSRPSNLNLR